MPCCLQSGVCCDHPASGPRNICLQIAAYPKENSSRPRTVVITQGPEPTIVATDDQASRLMPDTLLITMPH